MTKLTPEEKALLLHRVTVTTHQQDTAEAAKHRAILAAKNCGCTLKEIGQAMGINWQSVRWHIRKAHRDLGTPED